MCIKDVNDMPQSVPCELKVPSIVQTVHCQYCQKICSRESDSESEKRKRKVITEEYAQEK